MATTSKLKQQIRQGEYDAALAALYTAEAVPAQRARYLRTIENFERILAPTVKSGFTVRPAAQKSAATIPTTTTAS